MAGSPWHIVWSPAIPWLQSTCLLTGFAGAIQVLYRCWLTESTAKPRALLAVLPAGSLLWGAGAGMIWLFAA